MDLSQITKDTPMEILQEATKNSLIGLLGINFTAVDEGYIEGEMVVTEQNCRPDGILHGGSNLAFAETMAGLGSIVLVDYNTYDVLGIQVNGNHTGIVKQGKTVVKVIAKAQIVHQGKQTHVWNVNIKDEDERLISTVSVTNMIVKRKNG